MGNGTLQEFLRDLSMGDIIPEKPDLETSDGIPMEDIMEMQSQAVEFVKKRDVEKNMLDEDDESSERDVNRKRGPGLGGKKETKYSKRGGNEDL